MQYFDEKMYLLKANRVQTEDFLQRTDESLAKISRGLLPAPTNLVCHFTVLSLFFDLRSFFSQESHPLLKGSIIYHHPFGRKQDSSVDPTNLLEGVKNKIPIIYRTYDPHLPERLQKDSIARLHDHSLNYVCSECDGLDHLYEPIPYDSFLFQRRHYATPSLNRPFLCCMILRNRTQHEEYFTSTERFLQYGLKAEKKYANRMAFALDSSVHIYGAGWSDTKAKKVVGPLKTHAAKYAALKLYKFTIISENNNIDTFVSEKILDSFLTGTVPVFYGTSKVTDFVPSSMFIDGSSFESVHELTRFLRKMPRHQFERYREAIVEQRDTVFERFCTLNSFIKPLERLQLIPRFNANDAWGHLRDSLEGSQGNGFEDFFWFAASIIKNKLR